MVKKIDVNYLRKRRIMNLKRLFKRKAIVSLKDTGNQIEKDLIRKVSTVSHLRLRLSSASKFKVFENLSFLPPAVSLELVDYPGHVMRARGFQLFGEKKSNDEEFVKNSTFYPLPNLWFDGYVTFESTNTSACYIRLAGNKLKLAKYDGTDILKQECSFKLTECGFERKNSDVFQNVWIEDNGCLGVKIPRNSSSALPVRRNLSFLMIPQEKSRKASTSNVPDLKSNQLCDSKYLEHEHSECKASSISGCHTRDIFSHNGSQTHSSRDAPQFVNESGILDSDGSSIFHRTGNGICFSDRFDKKTRKNMIGNEQCSEREINLVVNDADIDTRREGQWDCLKQKVEELPHTNCSKIASNRGSDNIRYDSVNNGFYHMKEYPNKQYGHFIDDSYPLIDPLSREHERYRNDEDKLKSKVHVSSLSHNHRVENLPCTHTIFPERKSLDDVNYKGPIDGYCNVQTGTISSKLNTVCFPEMIITGNTSCNMKTNSNDVVEDTDDVYLYCLPDEDIQEKKDFYNTKHRSDSAVEECYSENTRLNSLFQDENIFVTKKMSNK